MSRTIASLVTAIAIAAASIGPAFADQNLITTSVPVSYADLDLAQAKDVTTLKLRIKRAADRVCGDRFTTVSMTMKRTIQACHQRAVSVALASVDAATQTASLEVGAPVQSGRF